MSIILAILVILLMAAPLVLVKGEFGGSDDQGTAAVESSSGFHGRWFKPIWEPGDNESFLFALQAALGAGVIGYVVGRAQGEGAKKPLSVRGGAALGTVVVLIIATPLAFVPFLPGVQPLIATVWTPPSAEVKSLLAALLAAVVAGVAAYVLGRANGASKAQAKDAAARVAD
jgi:cobalt/nickel transport protein